MVTENNPCQGGVLSPTTGLELPVQAEIAANFLAEYEPCITCKDLGRNCKGPKLAALGTIANVREYHRRLRSAHQITMKQIVQITNKDISEATVKDYFSHEEKGFQWTTVSLIDNAMTVICGDCVGLPPAYLPNCPATSSEIKEKTKEAEEKLRIAEKKCECLQNEISDIKALHAEQMNEYRNDQQDRIDWLKADVKLWRKIAFALLGALALVVILLIIYVVIDILK